MTLGAKSEEVFGRVYLRTNQDSSTPSDSARRDAFRKQLSHEIRRREGPQIGLTRFIIKS